MGLCLGSQGGPKGVGVFLWARYLCTTPVPKPSALVAADMLWHPVVLQGYLTYTKLHLLRNLLWAYA